MKIEQLVYKMLTTSTGIAMMDSGGEDGRAWQRNIKRTLKDFENDPEVELDGWELDQVKKGEYTESTDLSPTVSLFHYMVNTLELDDLCNAFNRLPVKEWDSDVAYGLSLRGEKFLASAGLEVQSTWNSYNGDSNLSQTIQGANLNPVGSSNFEFPQYHLIQIHQGADVRGGYTDAKLFKVNENAEYFTANPDVYGDIDGKEVSTRYNGYSLTDDDGNAIKLKKNSKINLYIGE